MYRTACGGTIIIPDSTREHLSAHPEVLSLLEEAIGKTTLPTDGSKLAVEVEMGRVVGRTGCITTDPIDLDDVTTFALRPARKKPSRVAMFVAGPEISHVVVIAGPTDTTEIYELYTAYVGDLAPKEPWDPTLTDDERLASIAFWTSHALVYVPSTMGKPFHASWNDVLTA